MRKIKVKKLKQELAKKLKRSPTKSEFRAYKKHGDSMRILKTIKITPEAQQRILENMQRNLRQPIVMPKAIEAHQKLSWWKRLLMWLEII